VWTAAAASAAIGLGVFLIWFFTTPKPAKGVEALAKAGERNGRAIEPAIQRGGTLTGSIRPDDRQDAIRLLTEASLVRINRSTDQIEPWLAESWTVSDDNLTYTFKLRANILWSDGRPLVADDVAAAFVAPREKGAGLLFSTRADGPLQVEMTFPAPFAPALRLLDKLSLPPGLGPFVLKSSTPGAPMVFERNPRYWRNAPDGKPLPYLDGLTLTVVTDQDAELKQLLSGQLDFVQTEIRPEDYSALDRADQSGKIRLYDLEAGLDADALWMNLARNNDDFRLAISAAVNRRAFCDAVYLGACDPVWSPITPGNPAWFNPDLPAVGPDPSLARAMLAGIGLQDRNGDGLLDDEQGRTVHFTILVASGSTRDGLGARFVRDELRKAGLATEVTAMEPDALNARRAHGDYEAIFGRFAAGGAGGAGGAGLPADLSAVAPAGAEVEARSAKAGDTDPAMNLNFWLQWQSTSWGKQIADLMRRQAASADRVQRVQMFADVQKLYVQHMPVIFFGAPYAYVATSARVLNAKPSRQRPSLLWNADMLAVLRP